jgi:hypothetical protein
LVTISPAFTVAGDLGILIDNTANAGPIIVEFTDGVICPVLGGASKIVEREAGRVCYLISCDPTTEVIEHPALGAARMAPGVQGYGLCQSAPPNYGDIRCVNNPAELSANLGSNRIILLNFFGWYDTHLLLPFTNLVILGQGAPGQGVGFHSINQSRNVIDVGGSQRIRLEHFRALNGAGSVQTNSFSPLRSDGGGTVVDQLLCRNMHIYHPHDEVATLWNAGTKDIVFERTILGPSYDAAGVGSRGPIFGGGCESALLNGCLLAGLQERQPRVRSGVVTMANSVVAGWHTHTVSHITDGAQFNALRNVYRFGATSTITPNNYVILQSGAEAYLFENCMETAGFDPDADQAQFITGGLNASGILGADPCVALLDKGEVEPFVYANAGVKPANRDSKQAEIIQRSQAGTMDWDSQPFGLGDLPTLTGGPERYDCDRADFTSAEFRQYCGMQDTDNALQIFDADGNNYFEHYAEWLCRQP